VDRGGEADRLFQTCLGVAVETRTRGARLGLDVNNESSAQLIARTVVAGRSAQTVSAAIGVSSCSWIGPSGITVEIACL
jgi:hypothetical protein